MQHAAQHPSSPSPSPSPFLYSPGIPRTFHFVWLTPSSYPSPSQSPTQPPSQPSQSPTPSATQPPNDHSDSWRAYHPQYAFVKWGDRSARSLIHRSFPRLAPLYNALRHCAWLQSLLARLCVLYAHGGVYVDHDIECTHSLEPVLRQGTRAVVTTNPKQRFGDTAVRWSLLAAPPRHPMVGDALRRLEAIRLPAHGAALKKCSSREGRRVFGVLKAAVDAHQGGRHGVVVLGPHAVVDYGAPVPFMGHFTLGIYRSPRKHQYETWLHACVRKVNVWGEQNPTACRVVTYFVLGMMTGVVLNLVVYFIKRALDRRATKRM